MATALKNGSRLELARTIGIQTGGCGNRGRHIKSGDRITLSIAQVTPFTLCAALAGRLMEIENVVLNHSAALFNWDLPGIGESLPPRILLPVAESGVICSAPDPLNLCRLLLSRRHAGRRTG